jgi:prepilin-type N-terminal cleavage/methylation domain-containing protein
MECWSNGIYEMSFNAKRRIKTCNGFTLVEALFSVVLLGIMATAIAVPYISGFQSLDVQADRMLLDCRLRSRMEILLGTDFGSLSNGSEVVAVNGKNYTISWTAVNLDLDGDSNPEPNAKQVTVTIPELSNRSLTTILVDNENTVGKIP